MADLKIERRAHREAARLRRLLREAGVEKPALDMARPVIDNTAWMKEKLEDARIAISESSVAISYDNGGGQTGIRENPHFTAYEKLINTYTRSLGELSKIIESGTPVRKASTIMAELTTIAGRKLG